MGERIWQGRGLVLALCALLAFSVFTSPEPAEGSPASRCNHGAGYHTKLTNQQLKKHKRLCHRATPPANTQHRPNIIFVMSNDQDAASLDEMPFVGGTFKSNATTYPNATFSYPLCCPSRASILRGQYPHNHRVWTNIEPDGYDVYRNLGHNASNVARWLDASGYQTGMFGQYLNGYKPTDPKPPGWDKFVFRGRDYDGVSPSPVAYKDQGTANNAVRWANESVGKGPMFAWVSLNAPHHPYTNHDPQYGDRFRDEGLETSPSFDEEDVSDKPPYVSNWPRMSQAEKDQLVEDNRNRLRGLLTVDATVQRLVGALQRAGELDNTYVVYWSDNGYHMGEHRLMYKTHPYRESISFPMVVKGPGVAKGATSESVVMNTDLAPTFAGIAGAGMSSYVDGRSMLPLWRDQAAPWRDVGLIEGPGGLGPRNPPEYRGVRDEDFTYVEYADGFREYYDLKADPYQLDNSYEGLTGERKAELSARVDALAGCAGDSCRAAEDGVTGTTVP